MKISVNWLNDYIDTKLPIDELSDLLTDIGLEVEGVEKVESVKGGLKDLVIGEVLRCERHENADRLQVCEVKIGETENLQIVCGAPNVAKGQKVVVAPVNATIHPTDGDPFQIKNAKIRGVESFGMICAEDEIGLGKSHDGIMVLPGDAQVGMLAKDYFEVENDTIIEIGLTPNRSDANSHLGVARDLAAGLAVQKKIEEQVKWPNSDKFQIGDQRSEIGIKIEAPNSCPRYAGAVVSGIEIKPSPKWMQNKLKAIGVKPINNIVDITNFINHEYGQPLHAFDYDQIRGKQIIVKNLADGSTFTTLDGVERKLSSEDLMICDAEGGIAMAGVYGGLHSGVTKKTTNVLIESAYFDPGTIRRTELRHNLKTDAAAKFEKGIDPTKQVEVLKRACLLIQKIAGGEITSEIIDVIGKVIQPEKVNLNIERLSSLTGVPFSNEKAKEILELLGFEILSENDKEISVQVPLYRADVHREADVIEEILRIFGYNNVPVNYETNFKFSFDTNEIDEFRNKLSTHLSANGFLEIMSNSLTSSKYYSKIDSVNKEQFVKPLNSLNANLDVLRPDMLLTGLESIAYNLNRNLYNCLFYEFGKTYAKYGKDYSESSKLVILATGKRSGESWLNNGADVSFYDLKQTVEEILLKSGIQDWSTKESKHDFLSEGLQYSTLSDKLVHFGIVKADICNIFEIKQEVLYAEIDFDLLLKSYLKKGIEYKPISKFPAIERALALVIDNQVNYQQIEEIGQAKGGKYLKNIRLFDIFRNEEKLGKNKKSYAVNFHFVNDEGTLTNKQIDEQMSILISEFTTQLGAIIRD